MTELTGLTVWGETVKKVKTVRTKIYIPNVKQIKIRVNEFRKIRKRQSKRGTGCAALCSNWNLRTEFRPNLSRIVR